MPDINDNDINGKEDMGKEISGKNTGQEAAPKGETPKVEPVKPAEPTEPTVAKAESSAPVAEPGAKPGSRAEARAANKAKTKTKGKTKAEKEPKAKVAAESKAAPEPKAAKELNSKAEPKTKTKAEAKPKTKAKVRRRWPAVVAGTATLAVAVAAVGAGTLFPGHNATAQAELVPYMLPVGESLANCQGPTQLLAGAAEGTDPEFSPVSSGTKTLLNAVALSSAKGELPQAGVQALDGNFSSLFEVSKAGSSADADPKAVTGKPKTRAAVLRARPVDGPSVLRMSPLGEDLPVGAASVVVDAQDGDLKGLAAASCQAPSNELWLEGASTSIGRTAILKISNSSASAATVSLDLNTSEGPLQAAGGKDLVVAPGQVRSVVLAGLAPDQDLISVHLKSTGGAVSAVIQQSVLRGLTPGGVDYLAPVKTPSSTMVIPGVRVQAPDAAAKISGQDGYGDAATAMVITVPGAQDAVVEVKAYGPGGQAALPNGGVFTAVAGKANLMPLTGLPAGTYSFSIKADQPVTAAVRMVNSTEAGEAVDFAFAPSTSRLGAAHLLSLPQDASSTLVFTAPDDAATVRLVPITESGDLGAAKDLDVKPGQALSVDPVSVLGEKTVAVLISVAGAPVYGSQLLLTNDSANIAVLPIPDSSTGGQSITLVSGY